MSKLGSTPLGAEHDPCAPFNEPEPEWYEYFGEELHPTCHGCSDTDVKYYEKVAPGQYYFYCWECSKEIIDENIKSIL